MTNEKQPSSSISRRKFMGTAATAAGLTIVPRHVLGRGFQAPSDTVNVAVVGYIHGMGTSNLTAVAKSDNIVALCDCDTSEAAKAALVRNGIPEKFPKAAMHQDFRKMFEAQKDIDAVVVATPDHNHAVVAMAAMQHGKHVYVQKPLTRTISEARVLTEAARKYKVVSQMGNQGHSGEGLRLMQEWVAAGAIGPIREVHCWTNRPIWPQGYPRPTDTPPVPEGLDWDLWIGPSPMRPYNPAYHPFSWRGWVDFGVGAIGDMGAHLIDQVFWALNLTYPTSISASSTPWGGGAQNPATYPLATMVQYEFPERKAAGRAPAQPPVKVYWYDGGLMPARPAFLPDDVTLPRGDGGGGVFIGSKGILTYDTYGNNPRVYPESVAQAAERVPKTFPRIEVPHEVNFAQACKGDAKASSPFEYASALTETMLLGIVALRAGQGKKVLYDGANMQFTNAPDANQYLTREYRSGWTL